MKKRLNEKVSTVFMRGLLVPYMSTKLKDMIPRLVIWDEIFFPRHSISYCVVVTVTVTASISLRLLF
jgi:hypothetical protein